MKRQMFAILCGLLAIGFTSCEDPVVDPKDPVTPDEPIKEADNLMKIDAYDPMQIHFATIDHDFYELEGVEVKHNWLTLFGGLTLEEINNIETTPINHPVAYVGLYFVGEKLAPGRYTYSDVEGTPNSFGGGEMSYLPYVDYGNEEGMEADEDYREIVDGVLDIALKDGIYTIEFTGTLEDGKKVTCYYKGNAILDELDFWE